MLLRVVSSREAGALILSRDKKIIAILDDKEARTISRVMWVGTDVISEVIKRAKKVRK